MKNRYYYIFIILLIVSVLLGSFIYVYHTPEKFQSSENESEAPIENIPDSIVYNEDCINNHDACSTVLTEDEIIKGQRLVGESIVSKTNKDSYKSTHIIQNNLSDRESKQISWDTTSFKYESTDYNMFRQEADNKTYIDSERVTTDGIIWEERATSSQIVSPLQSNAQKTNDSYNAKYIIEIMMGDNAIHKLDSEYEYDSKYENVRDYRIAGQRTDMESFMIQSFSNLNYSVKAAEYTENNHIEALYSSSDLVLYNNTPTHIYSKFTLKDNFIITDFNVVKIQYNNKIDMKQVTYSSSESNIQIFEPSWIQTDDSICYACV